VIKCSIRKLFGDRRLLSTSSITSITSIAFIAPERHLVAGPRGAIGTERHLLQFCYSYVTKHPSARLGIEYTNVRDPGAINFTVLSLFIHKNVIQISGIPLFE
jgi:hypothetical protein